MISNRDEAATHPLLTLPGDEGVTEPPSPHPQVALIDLLIHSCTAPILRSPSPLSCSTNSTPSNPSASLPQLKHAPARGGPLLTPLTSWLMQGEQRRWWQGRRETCEWEESGGVTPQEEQAERGRIF